jgi:hypothetical protein
LSGKQLESKLQWLIAVSQVKQIRFRAESSRPYSGKYQMSFGFDPVGALMGALALTVVLLSVEKLLHKPRIRLRFLDTDNQQGEMCSVMKGEEQIVDLVFTNTGDFLKIWKPSAISVFGFIYFDPTLNLSEIWREDRPDIRSNEVFVACRAGTFSGMKYVAIPSAYPTLPPTISVLSFQESVICRVKICPLKAQKYKLKCQLASSDTDYGVHELQLSVKEEVTT